MFQKFMAEAAEAAGLQLNDNQLQQFTRYYEMLIEWNEKMNLTAITEAQEVAVKHMVDSLTALETGLFTAGCTVIDVGTGAGFPAPFSSQTSLILIDNYGFHTYLQSRLDNRNLAKGT